MTICGEVGMNKEIMIFDKCKQCIHYHNPDDEYDWCHMCAMEMDCFKAKKLSTDEPPEEET